MSFSFLYEWFSDVSFVWLLVIGTVAVIAFILIRDKDTKKEKEKSD